jgi:hypothetical protein
MLPKEMIRSASVKVRASNYKDDLETELKNAKDIEHPVKIPKKYMRVRSQKRLWSHTTKVEEMRPLDPEKV